jgi:FKBP-type peptidyl-prolyl cis-trans isomerase FkpA
VAALVLVAHPAFAAKSEAAAASASPVTEEDKTFYALGLELARGVSIFSLSPRELQMVLAGLGDGTLKNADGSLAKQPAVDREQYTSRLQTLAQERQKAAAPQPPESSLPAAPKTPPLSNDEFLQAAAKEKGARRLLSGVIFTPVRKLAHGRSPRSTDTVRVHYRGTLTDGTEFDSSYSRGEPATFGLNAVIPCWTQGVAVMKVGEKARLVCPSATAYGAQGSPPTIPGGAVLVFEVELLGIEP